MSSVDDLVASLNANHIGQEAMELAALQAQLQQALLSQQMAHNASRSGPLNSPVMRTPSASISLDPSEAACMRHNSVSSTKMRCSIDETPESDDMDEDERMVEDLLLASPASPSTSSAPFSRTPQSSVSGVSHSPAHRPRKTSLSVHMIPLDHSHHELPSPNTSLFTTTDPFYLASLQNAHSHAPSSSVFAQAGRPSAHSPFLKHHMSYSSFGHGYQSVAPDHQPHHNMFAATAAAFSS
ncbi:hypothetical protein DICSQDRAFT_56782 [Dichomitus squalens LYAD-421 SS1]|uniref:uncharacterized protein n=1 Tax=Dichomitus squalens (strain LYAD-421) TaxID=732165 RepID=UPI0004415E6B|nr:uncharacterized protein DICSQDRAFT_56782 [Dichomitus squalens LYAD-421 SS1]EJF63075.1 hypothetical protein DICSQDRAFT_56782 [Dichomitus squalens LYAD-421 SS1]